VYFALGIGLTYLYFDYIPEIKNIWWVAVTGLFAIGSLLYLGLEFYSLRLFVPIIYGVLEITIAILSIVVFSLKENLFNPTNIVLVYSTLYILVRGYDNIYRYYEKNKDRDHWIKNLVNKKLILAFLFASMA